MKRKILIADSTPCLEEICCMALNYLDQQINGLERVIDLDEILGNDTKENTEYQVRVQALAEWRTWRNNIEDLYRDLSDEV